MLTRGLLVVLVVVWAVPRLRSEPPPPPPTAESWRSALRAALESRFVAYADDGSLEYRNAVLDVLDALAEAAMNAEPEASTQALDRALVTIPHVDSEVIDLRDGERAVIWTGLETAIYGGGARLSLFARIGVGWRLVGHVDSEDTSHVHVAAVHDGIAILAEELEGNGAPPSRAHAAAIVDERVVTVSTEHVADVRQDSDQLQLWRRAPHLHGYRDDPIMASRWVVTRAGRGLAAIEESLTPWIETLDRFCSGSHPDLATPAVRAKVASCLEESFDVRWTAGGAIEAQLAMDLWCGSGADSWDRERAYSGVLTLRPTHDGWRITDVAGCTE